VPIDSDSTHVRLIKVAEQLFAERGVEGVSLRQIANAAGTANNAAVQYHFGSKEALVQAIFEFRIPQVVERRTVLRSRADPQDLRAQVEAHLLPVVDLAELKRCYYTTFLEQFQGLGLRDHPFMRLPDSLRESHRDFLRATAALLPGLPEEIRQIRLAQMTAMCLHACADRERSNRSDDPPVSFALHVNNLFDALVGYLTAPVSPATESALLNIKDRNEIGAARA